MGSRAVGHCLGRQTTRIPKTVLACVLARRSHLNSVGVEILQNRRSGGENLLGNFGRGEPFNDVFLVEEILID